MTKIGNQFFDMIFIRRNLHSACNRSGDDDDDDDCGTAEGT
jgi:hypothetical protein